MYLRFDTTNLSDLILRAPFLNTFVDQITIPKSTIKFSFQMGPNKITNPTIPFRQL